MKYIADRLAAPSTHAGIALALQASKSIFPQYSAIIDGITALFAALAVHNAPRPE